MNLVKQSTKNFILGILIGSFVVSPFHNLSAQQNIGNASASGTLSGSIQFGGTIANILNCSGITPGAVVDFVGDTVSSLFNSGAGDVVDGTGTGGVGTPVGGAIDTTGDLLDGDIGGAIGSAAETAAETAALVAPGTPAADVGTRKLLIQLKGKVEAVEEEGKKTTDNTKWQVFKENCLDKIVRDMAVRTLNRITLSTVEWINSGFHEDAFFLKNPDQYFANLAQDEFLVAFGEINLDPSLQPFGGVIVATITNTIRRRLEQNVTTSMQAVLNNATYEQWGLDFSVGGWSAYTAYIEPNNNVFGSYLVSTDQIARRTAGTQISKAWSARAELESGLGFMSQKECVATLAGGGLSYIPPGQPLHFPSGTLPIRTASDIPPNQLAYIEDELVEYFEEDQVAIAEEARRRSICTQWKTLTPGNWIANSLNSATTDSSQNQLISADEWNENLGLIFDALILQAFNGISNMYSPDGNYSSNPNDPNYNAAWAAANDSNFGNNFVQGGGGNPGYLNINNLSEIIQTQQDYQQSATLLISELNLLVQRIRELDYCIPGPFPTWESAVSTLINNGLLSFSEPPSNYTNEQRQEYFADLFQEATGVTLDAETADITTSGQLNAILSDVLNQYALKIDEFYTGTDLPSNRSISASYFDLMLSSYIPALQGFVTESSYISQNIASLQEIQGEIQPLIDSGTLSSAMSQQIMQQVGNLPYLVNTSDVTNIEQMLAGTQSIVGNVTEQRNICVAEVESADYAGLNYRKEYQYELSSFVDVLSQHDSFLEDTQFGFGDDDIFPATLPGNSLLSTNGLDVFEDFLGPLF